MAKFLFEHINKPYRAIVMTEDKNQLVARVDLSGTEPNIFTLREGFNKELVVEFVKEQLHREKVIRIEIKQIASTIGIPNLDDDDLYDETWEHFQNTFDHLSKYISYKREARKLRVSGKTSEALGYEEGCQEHYDKLPDWAKW